MSDKPVTVLDCTLRDGGYYNAWDFSPELVQDYLAAVSAAGVDYAELGFRSFDSSGFRGACAFTTDEFIRSLNAPTGLKLGVMMNAAELHQHPGGPVAAAQQLFVPKAQSPVTLVRFACHLREFEATLPVCEWLKSIGYEVGINLMQIADRSDAEVLAAAAAASHYPLDVLYFADSMGSLDPDRTAHLVGLLKQGWSGAVGIHTHDNMGYALANTLRAAEEGVSWLDATVTGMGRGPGNAKTEYLMAELIARGERKGSLSALLGLVRNHFEPMRQHFGWGANTYYYLAGKYGIHPTYIQEMLSDRRYSEGDILAVIEHLKAVGGKSFNFSNINAGRALLKGPARGEWPPREAIAGREVLILASGPGVHRHRGAIEAYIRARRPVVIALNANRVIDEQLIDYRAACHPVRLLADCGLYADLPQPLICPLSMLPSDVREALHGKEAHDFGLEVEAGAFAFSETVATLPTGLVIAYALAIATSGGASRIAIAGMDGYGADDPRDAEMDDLLAAYVSHPSALTVEAVTPSRYRLPKRSVYALGA